MMPVPAVPCADGFDPAKQVGTLPDKPALPEGYRFAIHWTQVPSCQGVGSKPRHGITHTAGCSGIIPYIPENANGF